MTTPGRHPIRPSGLSAGGRFVPRTYIYGIIYRSMVCAIRQFSGFRRPFFLVVQPVKNVRLTNKIQHFQITRSLPSAHKSTTFTRSLPNAHKFSPLKFYLLSVKRPQVPNTYSLSAKRPQVPDIYSLSAKRPQDLDIYSLSAKRPQDLDIYSLSLLNAHKTYRHLLALR